MNLVAFDTETSGLDWWDPTQQVFLVTWADEHGSYHAAYDDDEGILKFWDAIDAADLICGHNLPFDIHQVRETFDVDILKEFDVKIADTNILARLVFPAGAGGYGNYKLKTLSTKYLSDEAADGEDAIKQYAKDHGIRLKDVGGYRAVWVDSPEGAELMEFYARLDAKLTRELYLFLIDQLPAERKQLWDLEMDTMRVLIEAERVGVATDQARVYELKRDYEEQQAGLYDVVSTELGDEALGGAGSDAALREALQMVGIPLHRKTPTGELSVNQFALQEFAESYEVIGNLLEYRRVSKFLSTYIGALEGNDVIHTSFHQCDAWTGRMSSSRPNMQNLPSRAGTEIREVFVPRPGHCFVVSDYESIEVRLLAYYLNDQEFSQKIDDGWDAHAWMASQIWGGDESEYFKGTPGAARRSKAKNRLFAITYGAGGGRLMDMMLADGERPDTQHVKRNGPPWCECEGCQQAFKIKGALPGYWDLAGRRDSRIRTKVQMDGFVTTLMGRKQVVDKSKSYVGLNALIQGSAADVMKQGLVNVAAATRPYRATPLLVVHDEVVVEVPSNEAETVQVLVENAMNTAADIFPRLSVSSSIVYDNYANAK
jgi:DNA polymerase-1